MRCRYCGGRLIVADSRETDDMRLRKRVCESCREEFYTKETFIEPEEGMSIAREMRRKKR